MKIRQIGTELFHAEAQTGMTKQTVAFRNFANVPKIEERLTEWVTSCVGTAC